jgi:hypothetical protein
MLRVRDDWFPTTSRRCFRGCNSAYPLTHVTGVRPVGRTLMRVVRLRVCRPISKRARLRRLRDLLAEDVRLDLASRARPAGRKDVFRLLRVEVSDCFFSVGVTEGRPALLVRNPADAPGTVRYPKSLI